MPSKESSVKYPNVWRNFAPALSLLFQQGFDPKAKMSILSLDNGHGFQLADFLSGEMPPETAAY